MLKRLQKSRPVDDRALLETLGESKARYQALSEALPDAVFWRSLTGQILDCNSAACRLYGYTREEMLSLTAADLAPPDISPKSPTAAQAATMDGAVVDAQGKKKDGTAFALEMCSRLQASAFWASCFFKAWMMARCSFLRFSIARV